MAVVNANYEYLYVDVGTNGRISDGGVIRESSFGDLLESNRLNLPSPAILPGTDIEVPYVFVGDEAFRLTTNLMKPYSIGTLTTQRIKFNEMLSRSRNVVECTFGQKASRFHIYRHPLRVSPEKSIKIVLAKCFLHNFLKKHSSSYALNDMAMSSSFMNGNNRNEDNVNRNSAGNLVREKFCEYFNNY